jgi:hypothetical protein
LILCYSATMKYCSFRIGDVYAVRIGDLAVKHSDVVTTVVTMTKPLLNFTYDTNLTVSSSTTYIKYEESFCAEVRYDETKNWKMSKHHDIDYFSSLTLPHLFLHHLVFVPHNFLMNAINVSFAVTLVLTRLLFKNYLK